MKSLTRRLAWVAAAAPLWAPLLAQAHPSSSPSSAGSAVLRDGGPLDAKAGVPPLSYRSPLAGYKPYADTEPGSWIDSNDRVGRIGGWRAYAREAQRPDAAASSDPQAKPAGHPHH